MPHTEQPGELLAELSHLAATVNSDFWQPRLAKLGTASLQRLQLFFRKLRFGGGRQDPSNLAGAVEDELRRRARPHARTTPTRAGRRRATPAKHGKWR